ncbi:phosphatidate cytidylyltransferase [Blastococcus sp. TF02A-30]|uniref:phosphatidate cytidylyltransferase n=1 Tax=Blastococcus sp. TF02A-30 TaxID=2250580 RepID=UPI000DE891F2|nr:phosphatidate cytidylyltransferase [Blastococcus sp. TF02A-30]RBY86283.1 phosphatidate cytidylyltransferase [Blastococcus sp. TF02A-30]
MTPTPADRPGALRPGAQPFSRAGTRAEAGPGDDTGPVHRSRPVPPLPPLAARAPEPAADATAEVPAVVPDETTEVPAVVPDDAVPVDELPETEKPVKQPGRAGRDLGAAIGVGAGLGALILATLFIWRPSFLGVIIAAMLVAVVELTRALKAGGFRAPLVPLLVGVLAMLSLAWSRGPTGLITGFLLTVLAVLLWRLADGPAGYLRDASAGVLVALYVPLLAGFAVLLLEADDGVARVLVFIGTVVCSDVGGYAAGVLFGKHPMAPSISPKKSWEGFAGSVAACVLVGVLVFTLTFHVAWWGGVLFGVALAASATLGDLAESLIKRDLGIKDMGNLLPGHGGIMDRLDSLLPSAAVAYLLLSVLAPV